MEAGSDIFSYVRGVSRFMMDWQGMCLEILVFQKYTCIAKPSTLGYKLGVSISHTMHLGFVIFQVNYALYWINMLRISRVWQRFCP